MLKAKSVPFGNLPDGTRFAFANGNTAVKHRSGWYIDEMNKRRRINALVNVFPFRTGMATSAH